MLSVHIETKRRRYQIPCDLKRVFEKLHFRSGLVWTVGLTVEMLSKTAFSNSFVVVHAGQQWNAVGQCKYPLVSPRGHAFFAEVPGLVVLCCHLREEESAHNDFSFVTRRFSLDQAEHRSGDWNRRE